MAQSINKADMVISARALRQGHKIKGDAKEAGKSNFDSLLQQEARKLAGVSGQSGVRFSAHAAKRLQARQIMLSEAQQAKLSQAVEQADSKGVKDSLILLNKLALIVNVKNRTVITAMDSSQMNGGIFTNIDGAMIINEE